MTSPAAQSAALVEPAPTLRLRAETPFDAVRVEALNDRVFGPGRFAKVSYAVREVARFRPDLSFCAFEGERLVGSVRQSEIGIGGHTLLFLGPFAVDADARGKGAGAALIEAALKAGTEAGFDRVLLVGDPPLFARYGFVQVEPGRILMPRPLDSRRLLWRALRPGAPEDLAGPVGKPPRS